MAIKTYDHKDLQVIVGNIIVGGYAPGTVVKIDYNADLYNQVIGADGEGARSATNDDSATIEITLLQTSETNDAFNALMLLDRDTNQGQVSLMVKDNGGRSLFATDCAYIAKRPGVEFGQDLTNRVWMIYTPKLDANFGGN